MPQGEDYESEGDDYTVSSDTKCDVFKYGATSIGKLSLSGDELSADGINQSNAYASGSMVSFNFSYSGAFQTGNTEAWNLESSDNKKVGEFSFNKKIGKGAFIVQKSTDGQTWENVSDPITDAFSDGRKTFQLYQAPVEELKIGYQYRVVVAYEIRKKTGTKDAIVDWNFVKKLPLVGEKDEYTDCKCVEMYQFTLVYGKNPIKLLDIVTREDITNAATTGKGFVIDKDRANVILTVAKDGGQDVTVDNFQEFDKQGNYEITATNPVGLHFTREIQITDGFQSIAPKCALYETQDNSYPGINSNNLQNTEKEGTISRLVISQGSEDAIVEQIKGGIDQYGLKGDSVYLYLNIDGEKKINNAGWHVILDDWGKKERQKILGVSTGVVKTGALIIQTKTDINASWENEAYGNYANGLSTTDFIANYRNTGNVLIYAPNGDKLINGLYIRILFAYELEENKKPKVGFAKTKRCLEKYEFYLSSDDLDAINFHNLSLSEDSSQEQFGDNKENSEDVIQQESETLNTGAGTVSGFEIDRHKNPTATYKIFWNGQEIKPSDDNKYTETGRYDIELTSAVGDKKSVTLYVDRSTDEEALKRYFGDGFIDGKRVYDETSTYPTYEAGQTKYILNEVNDIFLGLSGTITNLDNGAIVVSLPVSREKRTGKIIDPGHYEAVFTTNSEYEKDEHSGDSRIFTFHFNIVAAGSAPGPQKNYENLIEYAHSHVADSYPLYYGVTYPSAGKGYITLAFADREDAVAYAREYEKGIVEVEEDGSYRYNGSLQVKKKKEYQSGWELADAINYFADQAVEPLYFDMSDPDTYLTLPDDITSKTRNLRTLELKDSVIVFAEGEKEKLTSKSTMPLISDKPGKMIRPGLNNNPVNDLRGFEFVKDKYGCDSNSVIITDEDGNDYRVNYNDDVGKQLENANCPTGKIRIYESTIYGDSRTYDAVYIKTGDCTANLTLSLQKNQKEERKRFSQENEGAHVTADAFSIADITDENDPHDLILVRHGEETEAFASDQEITRIWSTPGDYEIKIVNQIGANFNINVTVEKSEVSTISFTGEGTNELNDILVEYGQIDVELPQPSDRYGYSFLGYKGPDGKTYNGNLREADFHESVEFEAQWEPKSVNIIVKDENDNIISTEHANYDSTFDLVEYASEHQLGECTWKKNGVTINGSTVKVNTVNDIVLTEVQKVEDSTESEEAQESSEETTNNKHSWIVILILAIAAASLLSYVYKKRTGNKDRGLKGYDQENGELNSEKNKESFDIDSEDLTDDQHGEEE